MEKIMKLLHKKLDKNVEKFEAVKTKKKQFEKMFQFDKLEYQDKEDFAFFENEIIYEGIVNKQAIEKAYKEGKTKMFDYYEVLSYPEKKRLMNYEIGIALNELQFFTYEDQKIYIPFFEKKMNAIYEEEMVLFDLKQYYGLTLEYKHLMKKNEYGYQIFASSFSSLELIYENENKASVYSALKERLYFLDAFQVIDYLTLSNLEKAILEKISEAYFEKNAEKMIEILLENECISEKLHKKLVKRIH